MKVQVRLVEFEDGTPCKVEILTKRRTDKEFVVRRYYYEDRFPLSTHLVEDILKQAGADVEIIIPKYIYKEPLN
jgi:hypothetical protein